MVLKAARLAESHGSSIIDVPRLRVCHNIE
jgi:hypothetical protein